MNENERTKAPADLLMCVGGAHYPTAQTFIDEAVELGVSKRIAPDSLPQDLVPGLSRIYFRHARGALVMPDGMTEEKLLDLLLALRVYAVTLAWGRWQDGRRPKFRHFPSLVASLADMEIPELKALLDEHKIELVPGIFGFCHFTGTAVVTDKPAGESIDIPDGLADLRPRAIHVVRIGEDNE